ncbi:helix-turn-helix transcriptional regulator [Brevundimonas nasdae]|uniref:Helix-turn-helix transcriptional regulator n=1 Tax=Brevundimonas nasdae TaxID=172043 RepID=A0ACD4VL92_9CAUL|nr:helix-turn-helix transcriptional regulator [Brevundimonas nasdae]WOB78743.1 helix-turn-helix transcriptional regulator [Brevundimonas nasdae]
MGDAIRARRHALKMSQEALADASRINRTHMGEVERGKRNMSIIAVMAVASALGCSLSELAGDAKL